MTDVSTTRAPSPGPPITSTPETPSVVMIGAPGAGKSTVGALVARELGVPFHDVDQVIEQRAGKPIAEIFVDDGEPHFRALERDTTLELLDTGGVLSLGGGAVMNADIRDGLAGHEVVWLVVSVTQATRRVGMNAVRPLLLGNVRSRLVALLQERTPVYQSVATLSVDTDGLKARAVAAAVVDGLRRGRVADAARATDVAAAGHPGDPAADVAPGRPQA